MTKFLFTKFDLRKIFLKQLSMKLNARKRSGKISEKRKWMAKSGWSFCQVKWLQIDFP